MLARTSPDWKKAADKQAAIVGKPSRIFYEAALADLGVPASRALMVGDNLEADINDAPAAGIRAVLVRTGKFRESGLSRAVRPPDVVLDSIAELPRWIESLA
jgi:ribonucleotide monophosphatase NagD (HAD superfamily)